MPRPSHRLDLLITPRAADREIDWEAVDAVLAGWERMNAVAGDRAGPAVDSLVRGGFERFWVERAKRVRLFGNQQGGFYTTCPMTGGNVAADFQRALLNWRTGGERMLACPECGGEHALEALTHRPEVAFARGAVVFSEVQSAQPEPLMLAGLEGPFGAVRVVYRRVG